MLGLKPKTKTYGTKKVVYDLPVDKRVEVSQWLHPKAGVFIPNQDEIQALRSFLKPGDVCLDIGAYIGDSSVTMALAVGKEGVVFAFEPNKYVFKVLEENAVLNTDKTNIIPLNFAAAPDETEMEFEYSDSGFCNGGFHENMSKWKHGHAFKLKVQGKNVYSFLQQNYPGCINRIRYIKIDAEGFDLTVLQSMDGLVKLVKPHIRIEVFNGTSFSYRKELFDYLAGLGYEMFYFNEGVHVRGQKLAEGDLMKWKHFDIHALPS